MVDLDKIARKRAWRDFNEFYAKGCITKCRLKRNKATLSLDWSGVNFNPSTPAFKEEGAPTSASNIVFKTVFENKSDFEHTQSLKVERQTSAICTSSLSKGYTVGCNVSLSLKPPSEIVNAAVGFSKEFTINNVLTNQEERVLTWSTEGTINVGRQSTVTAMLQIKEKQCKFNFDCDVAIQGVVKGTFYDHKKNIIWECSDSMRTLLVESFIGTNRVKDTCSNIDDAAYFHVQGKCGFKFGIEQETVIK